jgi:hypothetical protein
MVRLSKLKPHHFTLIQLATVILTGRNHLYRVPRPIRFAFVHAGITFATAATFPPAVDLPAIVVPILWAGSFALAYSMMAVLRF